MKKCYENTFHSNMFICHIGALQQKNRLASVHFLNYIQGTSQNLPVFVNIDKNVKVIHSLSNMNLY